MNTIKYIVWDWNGTLLDDIDISMEALNKLLGKQHLPPVVDKNEYRKYFQFPISAYYQKIGFDFDKISFDKLAQEYMAYYQPRSLKCSLHKGVQQVLQALDKKGMTQYLLSASNVTFLHEQLAQYDIAKYFKQVLGLDNIHAHSKKELAKHFIEQEQINPDEVVFIGDSVHDSEVANAAGCQCILIANGHEHKEKLLQTACCVVDTIQECEQRLLD